MKISIDNPAEVLCPICRASNEDTGCQGTNRAVTSGKAFRMRQGFTANDWQFEITTKGPVSALLVANDLRELDT